MTNIYHLALVNDWQRTTETRETYYPPTYEQDGFTHGTADPSRLIEVANHFYTASQGDWICLEMTEQTLKRSNVLVKFEPAAAVGDQDGTLSEDAPLFPHLYGGIHPDTVTAVYPVIRNDAGEFIEIQLSKPIT